MGSKDDEPILVSIPHQKPGAERERRWEKSLDGKPIEKEEEEAASVVIGNGLVVSSERERERGRKGGFPRSPSPRFSGIERGVVGLLKGWMRGLF